MGNDAQNRPSCDKITKQTNSGFLLAKANSAPLLLCIYFPPEGYLQSIYLLILFIYPPKVMSNCVSFQPCILNLFSHYISLFSTFYKHSYQWTPSVCRNVHWSKFCLGNTPGSPLLSKKRQPDTTTYTAYRFCCTQGILQLAHVRSSFYMGLKCCM